VASSNVPIRPRRPVSFTGHRHTYAVSTYGFSVETTLTPGTNAIAVMAKRFTPTFADRIDPSFQLACRNTAAYVERLAMVQPGHARYAVP